MPCELGPLHHAQGLGAGCLREGVFGPRESQRRTDSLAEVEPLIEQQGGLHLRGQPENPESQHRDGREAPE